MIEAILRRSAARAALMFLLATAAAVSATPDPEAERARLDKLRERIGGLSQQMQSKSGEKNTLTRALADAERAIGRMAQKLRTVEGKLQRQRDRLNALRVAETAQRTQLDEQRKALIRQLRAAYAMGRQEQLQILLNQQDPSTVSRMMVYYDYLNRARTDRMVLIRDQLASLAATEQEIGEGERRLVALHEDQRRELSGMEQSQLARQQVLSRLTAELSKQGRQLDRLKSDERDLKTLIKGLEEALSDIPAEQPLARNFAGLRGMLRWPAKGRIVQRFGSPKLGSLVWDGVMISAPEGREVRAVHHGRVAFADWLRGFGLLLILDHGDGYMTLYGHNQSLFKEVGDWVEVDEPVALVGSSGGQQNAGVYFGIRHQGRAVNPAKWCRRPKARKVG